MRQPTAFPVLFQSQDDAVFARRDDLAWVRMLRDTDWSRFERFERHYYLALEAHHARGSVRSRVPEVGPEPRREAQVRTLVAIVDKRRTPEMFVDVPVFDPDQSLPAVSTMLAGPGRPPMDFLCMVRAFLGVIAQGWPESPESVHRELHSNPTFARLCGFRCSTRADRVTDGLTAKHLPSLSMCEKFDEVMTASGLWAAMRLDRVRHNLETGVVPLGKMLAFDTAHTDAYSTCDRIEAEVAPGQTERRNIPRLHKRCGCPVSERETCPHPWESTDRGAAVVVKGPTRIHWAHKASVAGFADHVHEIPLDIRVATYAATGDGDTLEPHLREMVDRFPEIVGAVLFVLADGAYRSERNQLAVAALLPGATLHVPAHSHKTPQTVVDRYPGIDKFTPTGVPVCIDGYRLEMVGRDVIGQMYCWKAPDGEDGRPVCADCPLRSGCGRGNHKRRTLRTRRADFPQIDWDHPQHLDCNRRLIRRRTSVERMIKRIKVDLRGEILTRRDATRVQAHFDKRLLVLHLMLHDTS